MLLEVESISTYYGASCALFDVSLAVADGGVTALLGRNGMGKTTTLRSIMGLTPPRGGRIAFDGHEVRGLPAFRVAQLGIGLVPEGRHVFPTLSVAENLIATARAPRDGRNAWTVDRVHRLFPRLAERAAQKAATLSGGEQQMLAIGRALMTNPRLLILDEATEGLAPMIRREIWACLDEVKASGVAVLIVDKNLAELARLADAAVVLEKGRVAWSGSPQALIADEALKHRHLGV
jgi:branched-chain amino acid transport system ATP-binding protein